MSRSNIGGLLDYRKLADLNKPKDEATLRAAAIELRSRGLTDRDVAEALGLSTDAVTTLVGCWPPKSDTI